MPLLCDSRLLHLQAKSKKDAKQLAAAALLELMLHHVPFQELLHKSDKRQSLRDMQVGRHLCLTSPPP